MVVEDAGAEDLECLPCVDARAPERMRLRHFLDKVLQDELDGKYGVSFEKKFKVGDQNFKILQKVH